MVRRYCRQEETHRVSGTKAVLRKRLEGRKYDVIKFRNGYAPDAPEMLVEFRGLRRKGKGRLAQYAIQLGRVLEIKRWHN